MAKRTCSDVALADSDSKRPTVTAPELIDDVLLLIFDMVDATGNLRGVRAACRRFRALANRVTHRLCVTVSEPLPDFACFPAARVLVVRFTQLKHPAHDTVYVAWESFVNRCNTWSPGDLMLQITHPPGIPNSEHTGLGCVDMRRQRMYLTTNQIYAQPRNAISVMQPDGLSSGVNDIICAYNPKSYPVGLIAGACSRARVVYVSLGGVYDRVCYRCRPHAATVHIAIDTGGAFASFDDNWWRLWDIFLSYSHWYETEDSDPAPKTCDVHIWVQYGRRALILLRSLSENLAHAPKTVNGFIPMFRFMAHCYHVEAAVRDEQAAREMRELAGVTVPRGTLAVDEVLHPPADPMTRAVAHLAYTGHEMFPRRAQLASAM